MIHQKLQIVRKLDKYESIKSASEIGKKSLKRFNGFMFVPEINGQ